MQHVNISIQYNVTSEDSYMSKQPCAGACDEPPSWDFVFVRRSRSSGCAWGAGGGPPACGSLSSVGMRSHVSYSKVGTRYFFLSPLPLVRYLEIVLPLRAGPLFSKIC